MSRRDSQWAGIVAGAAGLSLVAGFVVLVVVGRPHGRKDSTEPLAKPPATPPDDLEALARCLSSEDDDPSIQIAIGWIVIQTARRRRVSVFDLLTAGHGYGPQKVFVSGHAFIRFAATDKPASDTTMLLAAALLAGTVEPSKRFQMAAPTSFVERSKASKRLGEDGRPLQPETTMARIAALQADFGGLVGRMGRWYFYRHRAPIVDPAASIPSLA
jgi:hypothetical protein